MPQLLLKNIQVAFPNFQNCMCCEKIWRILKPPFGGKIWLDECPWTFICSSKLINFSKAHLDNCLLPGACNVCGQISRHVFAPNGGYCLHLVVMWQISGLQFVRNGYFSGPRVKKFNQFTCIEYVNNLYKTLLTVRSTIVNLGSWLITSS